MGKEGSIANPWASLRRPSGNESLSGIRVDASHPWNLYWTLDSDGRQLLALDHSVSASNSLRLPRASGLEVSHGRSADSSRELLVLSLTEPTLRDIFWRLCTDIVETTRACESESEAVATFVRRTWRWHHLLRGGGDARLSRNQQVGLLGELAVLERLVMPNVATTTAVLGWFGPERAPKDFEIGRIGIESKALGTTAREEVKISSIEQLSRAGLKALFLCVTRVAMAADPAAGTTVAEVITRLRGDIQRSQPSAIEEFDAKVSAYGFDEVHDYSDTRWLVGQTVVYEVRDEFPRIEPSEVGPSVSWVQYAIQLTDCNEFVVTSGELGDELRREIEFGGE